ncbi:hypothetical protein RHGRI_035016 [Rhododendron griersonianum]|uniref:S-adenosyl-L-methionine-dependent methyltransferase n=1 Tax=Rhododendron griersonianum TaxID=479676 RepID=A0AAV6I3J6_9ERIC|nr:hypothetical protein RHGRI_035016 [Rhododendron griersonianum]
MRRCSAASLVLNSKFINIVLGFTPTYYQALPSRFLRTSNPDPLVIPLSCSSISETAKSNDKMENRTPQQPQHQELINSNPNVSKIQQLVQSDHSVRSNFDKLRIFEVTNRFPSFFERLRKKLINSIPHGSTSSAFGYDVVAIACPERYVVGVDLSDKAIKKAVELSSSLPNADYFTFLKEDFFIWHPTELFDLIFDYTFFCAIEPGMRSAWASRMQYLLKPDGELITLMFPISDHVGGPPYIQIMKRCCTPWGLKLYPSWKMIWLLELARYMNQYMNSASN